MGFPMKYTQGFTFGTYVIDQSYYMRYLTERLKDLNVSFKEFTLESIEDVHKFGHFDCIVNCSGVS